ncbi:thiamine diphosphokinase, partial [Ascoidea rubescens DSM 1968]
LWNSSSLHVCADGGANRLHDYLVKCSVAVDDYLPDFIIGDLDSIRDDIKIYYQNRGIIVIKQDTGWAPDILKAIHICELFFHKIITDKNDAEFFQQFDEVGGLVEFTQKAVGEIHKANKKLKILRKMKTVMLGGIGGRFDQTLQTISQVYSQHLNCNDIILVNNLDIMALIPKGTTYIKVSNYLKDDYQFKGFNEQKEKSILGTNCGLLPVFQPITIEETIGLKWDVKNYQTSCQSKISSSNALHAKNFIIIKSAMELMFNVEL